MSEGELSRGSLRVIEGELSGDKSEGILKFMFNPTEYTISKANSWSPKANKGKNVPQWEFTGGDPRVLQLELFFDSTSQDAKSKGRDLRLELNKLFNFMMIDKGSQTKGASSRMSRPPKCQLEWGKNTKDLAFDCYITNCSVKYTMFDSTGVPVRATANLTLKEARDREDRLPTNPTSQGEPERRSRTVLEGDRLDWIAYQEYGSAGEWRRIAEANRLLDPLDLRPGMVLAIPPRWKEGLDNA
jgi:hypothetical protein